MAIFDFKLCSFKNLCNPIAFQSNAKKPQKIKNYDYAFLEQKTVTHFLCYCFYDK